MKKHIIGISGYARAGKDTLADGLARELLFRNKVSAKFKFASALKKAISRAFLEVGLTFSVDTEETADKEQVRPLMVEFGRFCRSRDKDIFARKTVSDIDQYLRVGGDVAIVSDLRYVNEGDILREHCLENGMRYIHIDIERSGTFAANQEELDSIEALLDANYREEHFFGIAFGDRDVSGISEWAAGLADTIAKEGGRK